MVTMQDLMYGLLLNNDAAGDFSGGCGRQLVYQFAGLMNARARQIRAQQSFHEPARFTRRRSLLHRL